MSEDALVNTGAVEWPHPGAAYFAVRRMQIKLHRWAGEDRSRCFGDLFNLVYDPAFLVHAWERVSTNKGAQTAGIDKATAARVESLVGVGAFLGYIRDSLKAGGFRPVEVRQVRIPKGNTGKFRKLGIPTIADRVVQASLKLVLEPVFEADFQPCSYGFRPNRMHAVLCQLIPGGVSKRITAGQAARILDLAEPRGAAGMARWVLAEQLLTDLRRIDIQRHDVQKKLAVAVRACGTTTTEIFGVGPAVAAAVIGDIGDISRFAGPDSFAAYNGTAPVEVSSGNRVIHRLSLRGNRRMNHAVHMAAVTQIRFRHTQGRAYYDKKIAEGKTSKEALRALKRQVSDALYKKMKADARRAAASLAGPGGHPGNGSVASVTGLHPVDRLFGQATPGPDPTLRPRPGPSKATPRSAGPRQTRRSRPRTPA